MKKRRILLLIILITNIFLFAQKPIKVACVGNSITYGTGLQNREAEAYPILLQELLGTGYQVKNFGKPGATLLFHGHRPYVMQDEFKSALTYKSDIVVMHLGINDTDPRNWPNYRDEFVKDYVSLIDSFRTINPNVRILIAKITPLAVYHPRFESGTRDWHDEIQIAIEHVATYAHVELLDFFEPLYPYPNMLKDAVHPDKTGHQMMARVVYSAITGDFGGLQTPILYTDNMVLQCNQEITICGTANAGEIVTVHIDNQKQTTVTSPNGRWQVAIESLKAGGPYTLSISTHNKNLTYHNVMAGEVWICSGQSNMAFMLKQSNISPEEIAQVTNNKIRLFDMKARWETNNVAWEQHTLDSLNTLAYYQPTSWTACTKETATSFSAVAYYFGKMLQDSLHVPVGLICNAIGGSPTESWIDRKTLEYEFPAIFRDWRNNDFIQEWVRERAQLNIKKTTDKWQRHPYHPCYLYEAGMLPLLNYRIKGVIWYQGESNTHNIKTHEKLFKLLVKSWRKGFHQEQLPFYYVQLSSMDRPSWTWFRDSQRLLMNEIPHTGMAVSSDMGDSLNVHPIHKRPVGERLARWALHNTYYKHHIIPSGPLAKSVEKQDMNSLLVTFDYGEGLHPSTGSEIRGFEISSDGDFYYPAKATVTHQGILLSSEDVSHPFFVRYGWQPFTRANLINNAGLPASTFQSSAL